MNLILFGPPGAGKGTLADMAVERLGLPHISTGDLFRQAIKDGTELGLKVKGILASGGLVPDELTVAMVKERLSQPDAAKGWILDGVMSQSVQQLKDLWALRERISESISKYTPYKNDISVTVANVPAFVKEVDDIVQSHYPDFEIVWFGHIGDGNMHLNILKPENVTREDFLQKCKKVSDWVYGAVQKYNGSISAEHGLGNIKKPFLSYTRDETEQAYLRAIKAAFDPNGIMNPGKVI